jgi:hypothetical protein
LDREPGHAIGQGITAGEEMGELTHADDPGSDACYMRKPKA